MGLFGSGRTAEQIKREKIREYFEPKKGLGPYHFLAIGFGLVALFFVLVYFEAPVAVLVGAALVSMIPLAISGVMLNALAQAATDEDIDYWRDEDCDAVIARVCEETGYDSDDLLNPGDPIVIEGFARFDNLKVRHAQDDVTKAWRFKVRIGEDGITRFTPPSLTILHFTRDHLIAYQCDLDLLSGQVLNENISEYFWQDIVSLQIDKQSLTCADDDRALVLQWASYLRPEHKKKYAALWSKDAALPSNMRTTVHLKTTTGTGLEIVVGDERYAERSNETVTQHNDEAIARLRKLLRDRKAGRK
jgi:hypothetical protein